MRLLNRYPTGLIAIRASLLAALFALPLSADIPSWRTDHNGIYDAAHAPTDWKENLRFEIPLESKSNGSPILVGEKIIFTAEPAWLICANRITGEVIWKRSNDLLELSNVGPQQRKAFQTHNARIETVNREIRRLNNDLRRLDRVLERTPDNAETRMAIKDKKDELESLNSELQSLRENPEFEKLIAPPAHNTNGYTSYTPYYDGTRIYAAFGQGAVIAYDLDGNRLWTRIMEHPDHRWGGATMPQIVDGKLIVRFSNYTALNPENGETLWTTPSEVVFGTPTPFQVEDEHFLFTPRGEVISVKTGKVIQKELVFLHATRDWSIFNTPTRVGDTLYAVSGVENANGDAYAYRIPKYLNTLRSRGLEQVWHTQVDKDRYYSSPLVHEGIVYIVTRESHVSTLDAATGEIIYTHEIKGAKGTAYPSMVLAAGKIYLGIDDGHIVIMEPGRSFKQIARHTVGPYRSTPIFTDTIAYLRTYDSLQAVDSL